MNVAYMLGSLNRGGTETLLLDVCHKVKDSDIQAFVYHRKGGALEENFRETGVLMIRLAPASAAGIVSYLFNLRRSFKQNEITIVHAQQSLDAIYAFFSTLGTGIKVVQTFHGYDLKLGFIHKLLIKLSILLCSASYFVSQTQQEHYLKHYPMLKRKRTAVIYNGINFDKIINAAVSGFSEEFEVDEKILIMGMVGNFVPGRDHLTVCRGLKLLHERDLDFRFFFVGAKNSGNPHLYDDCRRFCSENDLDSKVIFTGSRSDVPGILKKLDAFVYSSEHDTFGIAVIEAMAAGIPVFVNDWKVMTEITEGDLYANIYKSGSEKELESLLLDYVADKRFFLQKASAARAAVLVKYSIEKYILNLESNYSKLKVS